jgi:hypothetical protein
MTWATQELPRNLWNLRSLLRSQERTVILVLSNRDAAHSLMSCRLKIHFNIWFHLYPGLPSSLFTSDFATKTVYIGPTSYLYRACYMPFQSHPNDRLINIW